MNRGRQRGRGYKRGQGCRRGGNGGWNTGQGNGRQKSTNERWLDTPRVTVAGNYETGVARPMVPCSTSRQAEMECSIGVPLREGTSPTSTNPPPGKQSTISALSPQFTVLIDEDLCLGCGMCAEVCSVCTITMMDGFPVVGEGCIACGLCAQQCPNNAITLVPEKRTTQEV